MSERMNEYRPDVVSPPGEALLEMLGVRSMTQADLAARMGRPKKTINEIIKGKAAITPETALQLEKVRDRSAVRAVDVAPVAATADHHLAATPRAGEETSRIVDHPCSVAEELA